MRATSVSQFATWALVRLALLDTEAKATAILMASLSSLRPHVASVRACNQSPLWGAETARSLAVLKMLQK